MNKLLLFSLLVGLVTSDCDCCSQCTSTSTTEETVEQLSGDCPTITAVSGGLSGTGYATRYGIVVNQVVHGQKMPEVAMKLENVMLIKIF